MKLSKYKLGNCVELYSERCNIPNLTEWDVSGVNRDKEFFEPSKQVGENTSNYKVVPVDYFACNLMHVGRDKVLPIAMNHTNKEKYVSPAYTVFKIKENAQILKEYFFIMLKSNEQDRYFWFHTDSSIRDGMSWEDFCDLEISFPPLVIQQKYVAVYNAMLANQQSYERGLEDLKLTCDAYIDKLKHKRTLVEIGDFIQQINNKNIDNQKYRFAGLSMDNYFIDSIADDTELDFTKYKIVEPNEYGAVLMKVGRDARLTIARNISNERYLISPAYYTFRITGIMPEYFMACVNRPEFERRGWFSCDTSARGSLSWGEFMKLKIPNATDEEQSIISELYKVQVIRIGINEKLKEQIKHICPVLIKGSIEEAGKRRRP
ncbi:restriction endonuclease subunit S [uncultured Ligilactobacillus sp.]|uniref:restriction endonuclease subunit S n=1 Tax=uncultured Ligilactobacillus sp. TaxID=2837633 RepID=UPI00259ACD16|nr:restriction endonuclease subunit S [uncultured Ligilactobacillus sp.]